MSASLPPVVDIRESPADLTGTVGWPERDPVPNTMRALTIRRFGPPEVLQVERLPTPEPPGGEVLVRVAAVGVGRLLDLVARSGRHPYASFTFPHVLGAEHAGTVAAVGSGVDGLAVGDHVAVFQTITTAQDEFTRSGYSDLSPNLVILGTHRQGADAEYVAVPAENVCVVPPGMGPEQAASLAGVGPVAANQFARVGGVGKGSRVIVQGATSGLGSTTALLAKHLGADVVVTSRHEHKRARLAELGFTHVLDAVDPDFTERAREAFGGHGADVVVDNLGAPLVWEHGFDALRPGGAVVSSGAFLGHSVPLNLQKLYSTGLRVVGVRTGTLESMRALWSAAADGFRTVLDRTFPLTDAAAAHRYVEEGGNVGRVLLAP